MALDAEDLMRRSAQLDARERALRDREQKADTLVARYGEIDARLERMAQAAARLREREIALDDADEAVRRRAQGDYQSDGTVSFVLFVADSGDAKRALDALPARAWRYVGQVPDGGTPMALWKHALQALKVATYCPGPMTKRPTAEDLVAHQAAHMRRLCGLSGEAA